MEPDVDDTHDAVDDPILRRVLSDSAYEHERLQRFSHFKQPIPWKLGVQAALLGSLALLLPVYVLYPASAAPYLPSLDPSAASPKVLLLGAFGGAIEFGTATLLVGAALYRVRNEPVTERQAETLLDVETFASYLGLGTGTVTVVGTFAFFLLGVGGRQTLGWYVEATGGINPFTPTGLGFTVGHFATLALAGALAIAVARGYVATRLARLDG